MVRTVCTLTWLMVSSLKNQQSDGSGITGPGNTARPLPPRQPVPRDGSGALDRDRLQAPDLVGVLLNGAVCREFPHVRRVENRLPGPLIGAAIGVAHLLLARDVCAVVGKQQVVVTAAAQERLDRCPGTSRALRD